MAAFSYTAPTVGGSADTWGTTLNQNWADLSTFLGSLDSAELAVLDGITATTAELNILDGVTATAAEINLLDGATVTTDEINLLDGVTATTDEINYVDGVTSAIQTQLDGKASDDTQDEADWVAGTSTTETVVSPAKVKAAAEPKFIVCSEQVASGTRSYFNTGGSWQTVVLSTTEQSNISGASRSGSVVTLPAGTYRVSAFDSGYRCGKHQLRVRDTSNSATLALSSLGMASDNTDSRTSSIVNAQGAFVLSGTSTIEVQHYMNNSDEFNQTGPLGSEPAVFGKIILEKVG